MPDTIFIVVRHGETHWNVEMRIQGQHDSPLTENGIAQAEALAGRLAAERIDALISSDLGRAMQTARVVPPLTGPYAPTAHRISRSEKCWIRSPSRRVSSHG